ncbi:MAG TPA: tripartite tricarboxylate transporter substrate-binding protein [Candidatus Eisenbacteria bacterium]|nr:tripartite tricarboxylate transporter substrate-binding protein [Candidatus Eisenbacteria bacterium]
MTRVKAPLLAGIIAVLGMAGAENLHGQEFYKDKVITFIVGYSPGGTYDQYTRLAARHIGKHLPGQPGTVVQNMPGAGGMIAANHLYNRTKPDGLTIAAWASPLILQQIMGNEAAKFDARKVGWVGIPARYDTACHFNKESGIKTVDDWFASKRPLKIASIGPGTSLSDIPKLLKAALGLPLEVLDGYKGGAEARLAVENGEADGLCASWQATKFSWGSHMESGSIRVVLQATLKSHPDLREVPLANSYAKTEEARELLKVADNVHVYQFPYSVAPGTPPERLRILQQAFIKAFRDPELIGEANKAGLEIDAIDGPTTSKTFAGLYELSPSLVAKLKELLIPKR